MFRQEAFVPQFGPKIDGNWMRGHLNIVLHFQRRAGAWNCRGNRRVSQAELEGRCFQRHIMPVTYGLNLSSLI